MNFMLTNNRKNMLSRLHDQGYNAVLECSEPILNDDGEPRTGFLPIRHNIRLRGELTDISKHLLDNDLHVKPTTECGMAIYKVEPATAERISKRFQTYESLHDWDGKIYATGLIAAADLCEGIAEEYLTGDKKAESTAPADAAINRMEKAPKGLYSTDTMIRDATGGLTLGNDMTLEDKLLNIKHIMDSGFLGLGPAIGYGSRYAAASRAWEDIYEDDEG